MKTSLKSFYHLLVILLSLNVTNLGYAHHRKHYEPINYERSRVYNDSEPVLADVLKVTAVVAAVAATGYLLGRVGSWCTYKFALYTYEPELDLLARSSYNEQIIEQELIPYILEQHDRNNSIYFFVIDSYKNYPLLKYKNNLDRCINNLWAFKFFNWNSEKIHDIECLIEKLKRIRRYIVTDYRFVHEQRSFDRENRKK